MLDYPLLSFCKKSQKHMSDTGMDGVFYFEKDGKELNILEHYTAFTLSDIETAIEILKEQVVTSMTSIILIGVLLFF